ncbi:TRAP transporter small permease [Labrenzia sp. DG1229]|uniref:TRAP transporter small permease n=1 Tax=Labrenzia sp. DG1229 TaxID=681847 RepID=UPI00048C0F00|nr:TRAP transporter small permease [Labrenzia sp. DG1229]
MNRAGEKNVTAGSEMSLPSPLQRTRRLLRLVGKAELIVAIVALVLVVTLSGVQAILRYTLDVSLWWAQESAQLTILVAYFFGASYVFKARQYILVEFFCHLFNIRVQMAFYVLAQVLTTIFAITTVALLVRFAPLLLTTYTPMLRLPELLKMAPLAIASAMIALTSLYYLAFALWAFFSKVEGDSVDEIERLALLARPMEEIL